MYADIILPANTTLEVEDIVTNTRQGPQFQSMWICRSRPCQPIGESKSDYEIVVEIAEEAGYGGQVHRVQDDPATLQKEVFDDHGMASNS